MTQASPHITVLMPVYNAAAFVEEAVASILVQSYPYIEFLIIDDGSTDGSAEKVLAMSDPRIRLIRHASNRGVRATLNEGLALASHELVARMDADDLSHPWRLEKQVAYMQQHPRCALLGSWVEVINEQGQALHTERVPDAHLYYNLTFECCLYHSSIIMRRSMALAAGGYREEHTEDYDLFWRLARRHPVHMLEETLLRYRVHGSNTHTGARRGLYEEAVRSRRQRHVRFYLGQGADAPDDFLRAYAYDPGPLCRQRSLARVHACLVLLDEITRRIITVHNPNNCPEAIRYMGAFKKNYLISQLAAHLPWRTMWMLLLRHRRLSLALRMSGSRIKQALAWKKY